MSQPLLIQDAEVDWETWSHAERTAQSPIWKDLIGREPGASQSLSLGIAELPAGAMLSRHRHAAPEVYYVLAGAGTVEIDGVAHPISAGSALFIPGNATHQTSNTGDQALRFVYVFPVDSFAELVYEFDPVE